MRELKRREFLSLTDVAELDRAEVYGTCLSKFPVYGNRMGEVHMSSIDYTI
jgi:hypothetical protein